MAKKLKTDDTSTEEKIKIAARTLFTQKGFDAVKTREIALEAGINLALLNYYFRSKQKLFEVVMLENMQLFILGVASILKNEKDSFEIKLEKLVAHYIDILCETPDLAFFIFSQMRLADKNGEPTLPKEMLGVKDIIGKQIAIEMKAGRMVKMDPVHLIANMIGLVVFPFIASPMLKARRKINDKQFIALMQERKKLIPKWFKAMLKP
ncbi:TetR/AcrR family transcriptional regulator [soil metagenome]